MGSSGTALQSSALAPACSSLRRLPRRGSTCDQPPPTLDPTPPAHPPPVAARGGPSLSPAALQSLLPHGATVQEHCVSVSPLQCPPADALLHVCVVGGSIPGQDVHELDCDDDDVTMNESDETTTSMAGLESGHSRTDPRLPRCEDDKSRPSGRGRKRSRRLSFSTRRHRQSGRKARPARLGRCPGGEADPSTCRTLASCGEDPSELPHPPDPPHPGGEGAPRPLSLLGCPHCGRQSGGSGRRVRMLRWAARCAALVVLVVCGGVLASRTILQHRGPVTDHKIDQEWTDTSANTLLMGVRINPVPLQEFKRHLRTARNPYDVFRIFFNKMDLSDAMIGELLTARPIDSVFNNKHKKSTEDEYSELPYSDHADYNEELAMAYGHMLEVEDSPLSECRKPRPEILHVEDELHPERRLFPECTIVNRCKNVSGCCGSPDMECGPKRIRIIQKAFFVLDDVGSEQVRPSEELVTLVPIVDHVECECRQSKRLPECNQDCPFPFTKMRPHVHCTCDCPDRPHEQPNRCHDVKEGRIPLDHDDLARIKSGQYLRPQCRIGVFDVKTGYCPPVPRDYDFERSRGRMQHDEHNARQKKPRRHRTK